MRGKLNDDDNIISSLTIILQNSFKRKCKNSYGIVDVTAIVVGVIICDY